MKTIMHISYSYGIMDLFHYGHLKALQTAAKDADLHVVGLVSDEAAKNWMGTVVSNEFERKAVLKSITCVDWVMPQKTLDPTDNLKKLHHIYPDAEITLFRGDGINIIVAREYLNSIGGKVKSIDYYERLSPIEILKTLNNRFEKSNRHSDIISTKANTLLALKEYIKTAIIEDIAVVTVHEFKDDIDVVIKKIQLQFGKKKIVVRSSSMGEDNFETSNAGRFRSILNIPASDKKAVINAIETVYKSYGKDGDIGENEQILIQTQTEDVKFSGVVFTRDIQQNRPYYVINYDDSGSTESVTSGCRSKSIEIAYNTPNDTIPDEWKKLFVSIKELEHILSKMLLDIEFAIKKTGDVVIFQVRPLAASYKYGRSVDNEEILLYKDLEKEQYRSFAKRYNCKFFSDMAFWNPAEIIGSNPHPLDYSLYRFIITHQAWNQGLIPMGYRKVDHDLMYKFGNKPFICVDYAFLSLIPSSISKPLSDKLKDYYLKKFKNDLSTHDKIEFEITQSCYDFSTKKKVSSLKDNGFTDVEIKKFINSLIKLTKTAISNYQNVLQEDIGSLKILETIRKDAEAKYHNDISIQDISSLISQLLKAIRKYGTPQFARQARYAFIARSFADSLLKESIWTSVEYNLFLSSIETNASRFEEDYKLLQIGKLSRKKFNEKHGHLRAGTYNICKPRYDTIDFVSQGLSIEDSLKTKTKERLINYFISEDVLNSLELGIPKEVFLSFMRKALEQREHFKHEFTKTLSFTIELIASIGERLNISRHELAYLDINDILSLGFYETNEEIYNHVKDILIINKEKFKLQSKLILPDVITDALDFDFIQTIDSRPNYITTKTICGEVIDLEKTSSSLTGKIVVIEKADPGYDWIFTKGIAGLVTKYGGAASHMAIRCAELEIPAVIGCGEKLFQKALQSKEITLLCNKAKMVFRR